MPSVRGTRYKRGMLPGALRSAPCRPWRCSSAPRARDAWTSPQPLYVGASRAVFSIAGDNAGNAFAVLAGDSATGRCC